MANVFTDKRLPYLHYSDFIKGQTTEVIGEKSVGFGCPQYSFSYDDSCDPPSTSVKSLDADKLEVIFESPKTPKSQYINKNIHMKNNLMFIILNIYFINIIPLIIKTMPK